MEYYLLKEKNNCGDEFDVEGYVVLDATEYAEFERNCETALIIESEYDEKPEMVGYEFYFGTNEFLYFDRIQEAIGSISVEEITESQKNTLQILGLLGVGLTPVIDAFLDEEEIVSIIDNAFA